MKFLLGNQIYGEKSTIDEIYQRDEPLDDVVIEGEIFEMERRGPFKNGSYLYKGAIYDGTNSMLFQFFSPLEIQIEKDMHVRLSGSTEKNQYTRGAYILAVNEATQIDYEKPRREDKAEKKRVELSVVGNYSTHISPLAAEQIMATAKELGHTTVALTDIGAVQGFPEAYRAAKKEGIKLVLGMKLPIVDDSLPIVINADDRNIYDSNYTVFDVETTGFSVVDDHVIEIGATRFENGIAVKRYQQYIKSPKKVPAHITDLTGITQEDVDSLGVELKQAVTEFHDFWEDSVLVAHNAQFDIEHLRMAYERSGMEIPHMVMLDTLQLSRMINTDIKAHGLDKLAKKYKVDLDAHHRADQDAEATGQVMMHMFEQLKELEFETLVQLNERLMDETYFKTFFAGDITILVQNEIGLENLYKMISLSHSTYLGRVPMLPLRIVEQYREGLLIGSGSHNGRLFDLALNKPRKNVEELIQFFDYVEIEPTETTEHFIKQTKAGSTEDIERAWRDIVEIAKEYKKPVVATGYVHYANKEDRLAQHILMYNVPRQKARGGVGSEHGYLHFRTTEEMMEGLTYVPQEERHTYVVDNSNAIADSCEGISPLPDQLYPPVVPDANDRLENESLARATELYGSPLPNIVQARLDKEVKSILGNGFAVIYTISADLVKKSMEDGYLVGSRGSVGSSFVATMLGITEVNPLKPHYNCSNCKWTMFFDHEELQSGYDLPVDFKRLFDSNYYSEQARKYIFGLFLNEFGAEKTKQLMSDLEPGTCPKCGHDKMIRDGQDIPFEVFLGFKGDKVPDIDLSMPRCYLKRIAINI